MTLIHDRIIIHPSAWTGAALGGKAGLCREFSALELAAFDTLLNATRACTPQQVTREQFDHPALRPLLADLFELLQHGRGAIILTGLSPSKYNEEDLERIYWGIGTHLGIAAVQSSQGERLGHGREDPGNKKNRGYTSSRELRPHTDSYEIIGLMCLQDAESGGETQLVSAMTVHNEVLRLRPDLLGPLYEGFPYATNEASDSERPVTPYSVPVFSQIDGLVSCGYLRVFMHQAAERLGQTLPARLIEALDFLDATADRDDLRLNFVLETGEIMLCNNFTTLHARNEFTNRPGRPRHLLRLWLDVPSGRKVVPELSKRAREYKKAPNT